MVHAVSSTGKEQAGCQDKGNIHSLTTSRAPTYTMGLLGYVLVKSLVQATSEVSLHLTWESVLGSRKSSPTLPLLLLLLPHSDLHYPVWLPHPPSYLCWHIMVLLHYTWEDSGLSTCSLAAQDSACCWKWFCYQCKAGCAGRALVPPALVAAAAHRYSVSVKPRVHCTIFTWLYVTHCFVRLELLLVRHREH